MGSMAATTPGPRVRLISGCWFGRNRAAAANASSPSVRLVKLNVGARAQFAQQNLSAWHRVGQQRFEGLPLALARSRVNREPHAAQKSGQDQEIRQHREQQRPACLRRGLIALADDQRRTQSGARPRTTSRMAEVRRA